MEYEMIRYIVEALTAILTAFLGYKYGRKTEAKATEAMFIDAALRPAESKRPRA